MTVACGLGTSWCLGTALSHIEQVEAYEWHQQFYRDLFDNKTLELGADTSPLNAVKSSPGIASTAFDGLLLALRDGYIRATGRCSTIRKAVSADTGKVWRLHASDPTLITTDEWRSGEFDTESFTLTGPSWQFIQIEVPDFMVKAIWPDWPECDAATSHEEQFTSAYTTPYLQLMQEAIAHFGLTCQYQSKKENLSDWFLDKRIEGEPISRNLANAMATLVRLPTAQRGGAKRMQGPDLRSAKSAAETRGGYPEVDGK
ncbi:hypothetical protein [Roseovarius sp. D22-M7]|uniref:hypothetical protein n=1 Tax=Roseovarius sp. D22-M7 TaxID=3127116 RepID=UPI00300FB603